MSERGTEAAPLTVAPRNWTPLSILWGRWCRCSICKHQAVATRVIDFRAKGPGEPLVCELCMEKAVQEDKRRALMAEPWWQQGSARLKSF